MWGPPLCMALFVVLTVPMQGVSMEAGSTKTIAKDTITNLPGLPHQPLDFKHYAGYLSASPSKQLFYWYVQAVSNPQDAPLLLWLNGGPGCSSLGGLLTGHGPYLVNDDGKTLRYHSQSWNKEAHVLYLESPAGVGFSYNTDGDYNTDDDKVADDNYAAMLDFFEKFPELKKNSLYITGESYAGIYIPPLLLRLQQNANINLKGAAIGNGVISEKPLENINANFYFYYYRGLIDTTLWMRLREECCDPGPAPCDFIPPRSVICSAAVVDVMLFVGSMPLNSYDVYAECAPPEADDSYLTQYRARTQLTTIFKQLQGALQAEDFERLQSANVKVKHFLPCVNSTALTAYLRREDVQQALHIRKDTHLPAWAQCSPIVTSSPPATYKMIYLGGEGVLKKVMDSKLRLLIYNGEGDTVCGWESNRKAFYRIAEHLRLLEASSYQSWSYTSTDGSRQVAGFQHEFERMVFKIVKGSGHMVPTDQPVIALAMIQQFLAGEHDSQLRANSLDRVKKS